MNKAVCWIGPRTLVNLSAVQKGGNPECSLSERQDETLTAQERCALTEEQKLRSEKVASTKTDPEIFKGAKVT